MSLNHAPGSVSDLPHPPHQHDIIQETAKRVDPEYEQVLRTRVRELMGHDGFPGSQPVLFERRHLTSLAEEDYFLFERSGERYLLFAVHSPKGPATFLASVDTKNEYWYVPHLVFPLPNREKYHHETLMDGELVMDLEGGESKYRYLVSDLMVINGIVVTKRSFSTRLGVVQQDVAHPYHAWLRKADKSKMPPFSVELQKVERSYAFRKVLLEDIPKLNHDNDGVIFTPVRLPYRPGMCSKIYHWKSVNAHVAKFRISVTWSKERKPTYRIRTTSNTSKYFDHLQLDSELAAEWKVSSPDGRVGEFRYDPDLDVAIIEEGYAPIHRKGGWKFVRFCSDKEKAIDEQGIKYIMHAIENAVPASEMFDMMDNLRTAWKAREKAMTNGHAARTSSVTEGIVPKITTTFSEPSRPDLPTPALADPALLTPITPPISSTNSAKLLPSHAEYTPDYFNHQTNHYSQDQKPARRSSQERPQLQELKAPAQQQEVDAQATDSGITQETASMQEKTMDKTPSEPLHHTPPPPEPSQRRRLSTSPALQAPSLSFKQLAFGGLPPSATPKRRKSSVDLDHDDRYKKPRKKSRSPHQQDSWTRPSPVPRHTPSPSPTSTSPIPRDRPRNKAALDFILN